MTTQEQFLKTIENRSIVTESFIYNFIVDFLNINNLFNSVKEIYFLHEKDNELKNILNAPAAYINETIYIDSNKMINDIIKSLNINTNNVSFKDIKDINLSIIRFIYHELVHAKQYDMINGFSSENIYINNLLNNSLAMSINNNKNLYYKKHDLFIHEYNANITSSFLTDFYCDEIVNLKLKTYNPYLYDFINIYFNNGYNENSPLEKYNKLINQKFKPIEGLTLFDKICYGMPIDKNEKCKVKSLEYAKNNNINIIEYLNNNDSI